jgi:hypothetical protein
VWRWLLLQRQNRHTARLFQRLSGPLAPPTHTLLLPKLHNTELKPSSTFDCQKHYTMSSGGDCINKSTTQPSQSASQAAACMHNTTGLLAARCTAPRSLIGGTRCAASAPLQLIQSACQHLCSYNGKHVQRCRLIVADGIGCSALVLQFKVPYDLINSILPAVGLLKLQHTQQQVQHARAEHACTKTSSTCSTLCGAWPYAAQASVIAYCT